MRDWMRTLVSSACGGVILAMLAVEGCVVAAAEYDPHGLNVRALVYFGGIGLGAGLVAWLCRRRDRTADVSPEQPPVVEVLTSRGEVAEVPEDPSDSCGCEGYGPGPDDGAGYVWDDARLSEFTRRLVENDRTCGSVAFSVLHEYIALAEGEYGRWTEIVRAEFRPVPVVPGKEQQR